jgi:glucosyl-dolichyl phosphate glucuronosyltransferase
MTLDVILPTFNRAPLLARTLESLRAATAPSGLTVRVLVVDNASTDDTRDTVERIQQQFPHKLDYVFVPTPGKPYALNAGLDATDGDLVGLIDDDEEIDEQWFRCIVEAFNGSDLDFIGGRCLPRWESARPEWLGSGYLGVIGWVDPGPEVRPMDASYPGILMGGNAVIRRSTLARAGRYTTALNRTAGRLLGCEDEDMYQRLLAIGARGEYRPGLIIYHFVPASRLTKPYFRRWCFWRGVSLGVIDRERPADVAYLGGVPRYRVGRAMRALPRLALPARGDGARAARFEDELAWWDLAGFVWGKHFHRVEAPAAAANRHTFDQERHA